MGQFPCLSSLSGSLFQVLWAVKIASSSSSDSLIFHRVCEELIGNDRLQISTHVISLRYRETVAKSRFPTAEKNNSLVARTTSLLSLNLEENLLVSSEFYILLIHSTGPGFLVTRVRRFQK